MIRRSDDAVCDPYHTHGGDEKHGSSGLASKSMATIWWLGPQNYCIGLLVWTSKPNGRRFINLRLKTDEQMKMIWGHASTSDGLLHREASLVRVSQFCIKIGEGATMSGARDIITEVTWKWSKRQSVRLRRFSTPLYVLIFLLAHLFAVEVRTNYPSLDLIFLLDHRGILLFCFYYK
jgi:hypothetical protein